MKHLWHHIERFLKNLSLSSSGGEGRGEEALSSRALSPFWPFSDPLLLAITLACMLNFSGHAQNNTSARQLIDQRVSQEQTRLLELYKHLHTHPELSFQEEKTSARVAEALRGAGYEVTTGVGRYGVVGVLRNKSGPTVLIRTDMDGLPVKEQTGLPYASTVTAKDPQGNDVPVMHACGHDMNMTCVLGAASILAQMKG